MERMWAVMGIICLCAGLGCGGGQQFTLAKAEGICLCEGQPIEGGRVIFQPVQRVIFQPVQEGKKKEIGKPALGDIGPDGRFVLTTERGNDGAVVGKHTVQVLGRYVEDDSDKRAVAAAKLPCASPDNLIVEVKAGQPNLFEIKMGAKRNPQMAGPIDK